MFSEGGGPGNRETLVLDNTTLAANRIDDDPLLPEPAGSQYYYRGGGAYMTNGSLRVTHCTIVQNVVTGIPAIFRGRPNMGGGGIAATIGNAHVVETIELTSSIVAGNVLQGAPEDLFTGSLLHFLSHGYNRVGVLDFSQILVPIPPWECLSRKHWPK